MAENQDVVPNTYTHTLHLAGQTPGLQGKQEQQQSTKTLLPKAALYEDI